MQSLTELSEIIPTDRYFGDFFSFVFPIGAAVIKIERSESSFCWRLISNLNGIEFDYNIEKWESGATPKENAFLIFNNSDSAYTDQCISPYCLFLKHYDGWRTKIIFVDGASASLVIDTAFLQSAQSDVYRIQFASNPINYELGKMVFETILASFEFKEKQSTP